MVINNEHMQQDKRINLALCLPACLLTASTHRRGASYHKRAMGTKVAAASLLHLRQRSLTMNPHRPYLASLFRLAAKKKKRETRAFMHLRMQSKFDSIRGRNERKKRALTPSFRFGCGFCPKGHFLSFLVRPSL